MKNTITGMKNSLERFNSIFDQQKKRIIKLEDSSIKFFLPEDKKNPKRMKKIEHSHSGITGYPDIHIQKTNVASFPLSIYKN